MTKPEYVRWFAEISYADVPLVGGKNASLGEMYRELTPLGVRQANGFAITAAAFRDALTAAGAWEQLHALLDGLDKADVKALARAGARCRQIVYAAGLPEGARAEIVAAWRELEQEYGEDLSVAVRSSATAEDLPTASFAGQHDTYLNIRGEEMVLDAIRRCNASLFTDRAISYRIDKGFDHFQVALSACVQKMVRSDLAASGVMFSIDTETGFQDAVFITGAWGLGENVVQGAVDPDEFYVHKPTFRRGHRAVLRRTLGAKKVKMVYAEGRTREPVLNKVTAKEERERFCLSDEQVLTLADYAIKIEDHYSRRAGHFTPMDIEWALDGVDGELYIVQARPETVASQRRRRVLEEYVIKGGGKLLATGRAVGTRCAAGKRPDRQGRAPSVGVPPGRGAGRRHHDAGLGAGDEDRGGDRHQPRRPHLPCGDRRARARHAGGGRRRRRDPRARERRRGHRVLRRGRHRPGLRGPGALRGRDASISAAIERPATHIMINLGNPELAFQTSFIPNDGVGLARLEFIINEYIKAHPMALLHPERVADDGRARAHRGHDQGLSERARVLHRAPVGGRRHDRRGVLAEAGDRAALGLQDQRVRRAARRARLRAARGEPDDRLPRRVALRARRLREAFALECAAMRRVREEMGLTNVKIMIPFCRRLEEADRVLAVMAAEGLERGEDGLEIYVMCEIPNNVILIDEFAKRFDGFSIGSNDLTQLTLGVDRDSQIVAFDFDERDPGVLAFLKQAVEGAKRNGRHSGICGQAPSDYLEIAKYLVELGIDSMSLTPDSVLKTMRAVVELEKQLGREVRAPEAEAAE